jgi:hypothetical protein
MTEVYDERVWAVASNEAVKGIIDEIQDLVPSEHGSLLPISLSRRFAVTTTSVVPTLRTHRLDDKQPSPNGRC